VLNKDENSYESLVATMHSIDLARVMEKLWFKNMHHLA
jgi:hypothetical protein